VHDVQNNLGLERNPKPDVINQKGKTQSLSIPPPKFVLKYKKSETSPQLLTKEREISVTSSVSNSVTTTPKATPPKSQAQGEKEKTPQSITTKSSLQTRTPPSNSKGTPNSKQVVSTHDTWSSPREGAKVMSNGTGTIVNTDAEVDNFWDEEDMSMEMITDVGDGEADEEVCIFLSALSKKNNFLKNFLLSDICCCSNVPHSPRSQNSEL